MSNSRLKLMNKLASDEKPTNSSRGKGLILETPYKPGFVEDKDLESVKMAIDKELSEVANAFQITTERTADTITRIDKLEIEGGDFGEIYAAIEQVDKVSKEGDAALAERIVNLTAKVSDNAALITEESRVRADADSALAERITTLKASSEAGDATLTQNMSVISTDLGKVEAKWGVQTNVNGKVSGIQLNNDGASSTFSVVADKFTISDGTSDTTPPFEVVGPNTRVKSLFVETLQSDNWNGSNTGWAVTKGGYANFQGVTVRGDIQADNGYFRGDLTGATGTFSGSLNVTDQAGNVGMKITNNQILIYDENGRLRVKLGRL